MILREPWCRESNEKHLSNLEEKYLRGDESVFYELLKLAVRNSRLPHYAQLVTEAYESWNGPSDELLKILWAVSKETGKLPDVPVDAVKWIPIDVEPDVQYTQTWEVVTERSAAEGDVEARGYYSGHSLWTLEEMKAEGEDVSNFVITVPLSNFVEELRYWESQGAYWTIYYSGWDASQEFGDEIGELEEDSEPGYSNAVLGGTYSIHLENDAWFKQIDKWVRAQ